MYAALDHPDILQVVFHPRKAADQAASAANTADHLIPVADGIHVGARFHLAAGDAPNILFFHGNGEIVEDYDDLGPAYNHLGINFLAVDYRGYGRSNGDPTVSAMMADCHIVLEYVRSWLEENHHGGPFVIMGRSLGSASALELASNHPDHIAGLIIESGFAYTLPLLQLLGVNPVDYGLDETSGFSNLDKIRHCPMPTLVIHAEFDHIIPYSDGQALYRTSPAEDRRLLKIPGANHNDIFMHGLNDYLGSIRDLVSRLVR